MTLSAGAQQQLWWALSGVGALILLWLFTIWYKGRPFASGDVFRASRLSRGNRLLPTQVSISPTSVVHYTPGWIGRQEESIHMAHIASGKTGEIIYSKYKGMSYFVKGKDFEALADEIK